MLKYFLNKIRQNSDVPRSIFIIFRDLININTAYTKYGWIIKYIKICL